MIKPRAVIDAHIGNRTTNDKFDLILRSSWKIELHHAEIKERKRPLIFLQRPTKSLIFFFSHASTPCTSADHATSGAWLVSLWPREERRSLVQSLIWDSSIASECCCYCWIHYRLLLSRDATNELLDSLWLYRASGGYCIRDYWGVYMWLSADVSDYLCGCFTDDSSGIDR